MGRGRKMHTPEEVQGEEEVMPSAAHAHQAAGGTAEEKPAGGPRPLHDNVWLLFPEPAPRRVGGVYVPAGDPLDRMDAVVAAAGPEVPADLGVGVGDTVVASQFDGMPVFVDGVQMRSMPADRLLAVIH